MVTLCFNSLGYYLMHNYLKQQIKKEIKARIKKSVPVEELTILILNEHNANDFKWIHEKEFRYHGTMYDIVSKDDTVNGMMVLHCITDVQETELFKNLGKYVTNTMNSNQRSTRTGTLLFNFLNSLYPPDNFEMQPILKAKKIVTSRYSFSCTIADVSVTYPPPKV